MKRLLWLLTALLLMPVFAAAEKIEIKKVTEEFIGKLKPEELKKRVDLLKDKVNAPFALSIKEKVKMVYR